jgi:hypothetical protein
MRNLCSVAPWLGLLSLGPSAPRQAPGPPNLAASSTGAVVSGPQNASGSPNRALVVNDGEVADYGPHHGYAWAPLAVPLTVTFPESTRINKVEVLLLDVDARSYDFRLEAQAPDGTWQALAERSGARAWVTLAFEPVTCSAMRLAFTGTTLATKTYHVVEVAAYDDPEPQRESALRRVWLASRQTRQEAELALLGVDEALELVFRDEAMMERVRRLADGERRWLDPDRDGDPDLIVFRDRGAIVVVLDEDDDAAAADLRPDEDSDCLVVDLNADGSPDRILDNIDDDSDGDPDRARHYYLHGGWFGSRIGLVLIWDTNDNNRMWQLHHYSYSQGRCQWQCDFGGNEGFSIFVYDRKAGEWAADWECPFYFYDPDQDGLAEVALRLEGHGRTMRALRFSMNADNDITPGQPYDYDFGVIALGPVELPEEWLVRTPLRAGDTGPYLGYGRARDVVRKLPWARALLVWDENDHNIDPSDRGKHERWEGVINSKYRTFPQIGGPPCGTLNKRYELDADNSGGLKLYASAVDGRLHLFGAEIGIYRADLDGDGAADRQIEYEDTNADGFFDRWRFDEDADGQLERTVDLIDSASSGNAAAAGQLIPLEWRAVTARYVPVLQNAVEGHEQVARALQCDLTVAPDEGSLEARRWGLEALVAAELQSQIRAARRSHDAARLDCLQAAAQAWSRGRYVGAAQALSRVPTH